MGLPPQTLPVFLPLRNLRPQEGLESFMQRELAEDAGVEADLAQRLLRRGRLLLLFDGLDEVADPTERKRVARWIEGLYARQPNCHFVVSSRFAGYVQQVRLDDGFLELHLRSMQAAQVRRFVQNWYKTVEATEAELSRKLAAMSGGTTEPDVVDDKGIVQLPGGLSGPHGPTTWRLPTC